MGACASVFKQFKGEEGMAPLPEAPKEETAGEATEVKPEVVANDKMVDDNKPSLESLLSESDEVKKETASNEKEEEKKVEQEKSIETVKVENPVEKAADVKND